MPAPAADDGLMSHLQQHSAPGPAASPRAGGGRAGRTGRTGRWFGVAMLAEAAALWVASCLHRDGRISLGFTAIKGEHFPGASIPELVIGAVLALGALAVLAAPARARRPALTASGFGVFGILLGLTIVATSGSPNTAADLTYHSLILLATAATFVLLLLRHPGRDE
jgi:glycerol uptake facilitator-like aquaporin